MEGSSPYASPGRPQRQLTEQAAPFTADDLAAVLATCPLYPCGKAPRRPDGHDQDDDQVVTIPAREARAFRVIDNRTSELTSWDTDLLPDALAGLNDLDIFSFDDVLPLAVTSGKTDPDDIPETPKNPVTRTGDLWVLGKHRIICGDSCDPQTVERLLDGAKPDLMVTDPPSGVQYDSSWRYKAGISTKDVSCIRHDSGELYPSRLG